jgi:radical S-adenosyl methionine domain-containing protein 2
VFLNVSDDIAVKRITQSNNRELELDGCNDIHRLIKARNENMRLRFEQTYNVDFTNLNNYQLVINTDNFSPEEVVKIITKNFEQCTSLK